MDLGIAGKRAAVAAASAGLGFGAAAALAAEGVQVVICGRDGPIPLNQLPVSVERAHGSADPSEQS